MKTVQVGFGHAASYHRNDFPKEVKVIGVVDTDPQKREMAENQGFRVFSDYSSAFKNLSEEVDFWDVCVPSALHFVILRDLLRMGATTILIEKPICLPSEIYKTENLLKKFSQARICVQEQYLSSAIVETIRKKCREYGISKPRILMEQSKNRIQDIEKGRFIDSELGVFGYEVPHALVAVAGTGKDRYPHKIINFSVEDMLLPNGDRLANQGKGEILYLTKDGCQVRIFSAMNGEIGYPFLEVNAPMHIPYGDATRYRVLLLEEENKEIIGQFEPISDWPRFKGRVLVWVDDVLQEQVEIEDRPIKQHLAKVIQYFRGERENPAPPQEALLGVKFLAEIMKRIK